MTIFTDRHMTIPIPNFRKWDTIYLSKIANGWLLAPVGDNQIYSGSVLNAETYFAETPEAMAKMIVEFRLEQDAGGVQVEPHHGPI